VVKIHVTTVPNTHEERITVTPERDDIMAFPPEADVPDGSDVIIQLMRAMF
jgi:hypothetical protein